MKIGCLQFSPQLGDVNGNLNCADSILDAANPQNLDLLVLLELAFTGSNSKSLEHIATFLEPRLGITFAWARFIALKYECVVSVGFPEKTSMSELAFSKCYNSSITVDADGEVIANYRKSFLDDSDKIWASEGLDGFFAKEVQGLGKVAMGIGTDLNPYKFKEPWTAFEFACHILRNNANLVIVSMAWTSANSNVDNKDSKEADLNTLTSWVGRLEPLIHAETRGEIIVVFSNRCGIERVGMEEKIIYAGTSCVLGIEEGEVKVYDLLGHGEEGLLVVDTAQPAKFKLVPNQNTAIAQDTTQFRNLSALEPGRDSPGPHAIYRHEHSSWSSSTTSISSSPLSSTHSAKEGQQEMRYMNQSMENENQPPDSPSSVEANTGREQSPDFSGSNHQTPIRGEDTYVATHHDLFGCSP